MTKFYTKTGDEGFTGRLGEGRLPKNHVLIEAIGTIDEATSALGLARAQVCLGGLNDTLVKVQKDLYHIMAELSATPANAEKFRVIEAAHLAWLEAEIERYTSSVQAASEFIVPGDTLSGSALALARTIVRRAERRVVELQHIEQFENPIILPYLNRLSSLCFVLELLENQRGTGSGQTLAKD